MTSYCSPLITAVQHRTRPKMNSHLPRDVQAAWVISRWVAVAMILGKMSACYPPPCQRQNIEEIRYAWWSHYFSRKSQSVCSLLTFSGSCSQDVSVSSQPGYLVLNNQWAWYTKASFQLGVVLEWLTHLFFFFFFWLIVLLWRETLGLFNIMFRILFVGSHYFINVI